MKGFLPLSCLFVLPVLVCVFLSVLIVCPSLPPSELMHFVGILVCCCSSCLGTSVLLFASILTLNVVSVSKVILYVEKDQTVKAFL